MDGHGEPNFIRRAIPNQMIRKSWVVMAVVGLCASAILVLCLPKRIGYLRKILPVSMRALEDLKSGRQVVARIHKGMSEDQVRMVLGMPVKPQPLQKTRYSDLYCPKYGVSVFFDSQGHVVGAWLSPHRKAHQAWVEMVTILEAQSIRESRIGNLDKGRKLACLIRRGMPEEAVKEIFGRGSEGFPDVNGNGGFCDIPNDRCYYPYHVTVSYDAVDLVMQVRLSPSPR